MSARSTIEREVKLGVWPGFVLPDLNGALDGATATAPEKWQLEAVYFDTADLRLLRRGVTLRFRRGEDPADMWTAKLPPEAPELALARREISLPGQAGNMPALLADLVRGWALGATLAPVARLRTLRNRTTLRDADEAILAVVDDDEVSIVRGSRVAARFRELELELADGASPKLLGRLARRLRAAGAQPVDQIPKLVRALGPPALAPWDLAAPELGSRPSTAELVRAGLVGAAARLVDHIATIVLDDDVEGVHQARVGIRRLRSDLRTVRPLLDAAAVRPLRHELRWLAGELGEVRDLDVLLEHLRADSDMLDPDDRAGAQEVLARLAEDRAAAYERVREALRTPRCAELLEEVARIASAPPFAAAQAKRPAAQVLPALVRGPLRKLRREAKRLGEAPDDSALHRMRIQVKRVRYAVDLVVPVAGEPARRTTRALARVQDVLGDHNDARTAIARLRALGPDASATGSWAAGALGGLQLARAADCRARFPAVWTRAAAKKRWDWID
jgi:CHAD domain-containing protein